MTVETAAFISGLVPAYPPGSDSISEGDDHLRLLKTVLQSTFPNANAAINGIHTGTSEPSSKTAGTIWYDTTASNKGLKVYNGSSFITLPISPEVAFKLMGATNVGWVLPTADGSANQYLKTDGSGNLDWASIVSPTTLKVQNISYFAGDASASVRSASMTTAFSFTVAKASASTDLLLQVQALTGIWNYGTSQTGNVQIYSATGTAALGAVTKCTGEWNNLGASASANNEVRGITSITRVDTSGLAIGDHIFNIQFTSGDPSGGGTSVGEYNAVAWEIA